MEGQVKSDIHGPIQRRYLRMFDMIIFDTLLTTPIAGTQGHLPIYIYLQ